MTVVLLVDDDEDVRGTLARMLEQGGFTVVAVDNGLQALVEIRQRPIRAIVTDIMMPFLEGRRFYDELASETPEMAARVIFMTGSDDAVVRDVAERTGRPVLRKPVKVEELQRIVRAVSETSSRSDERDREET